MRLVILIVIACVNVNAAELKVIPPTQVIELNDRTLLQHVWPGMTIKQGIQILGEPEEIMNVSLGCDFVIPSYGEFAMRYGIYWLIPAQHGSQIQCIVHQRGIRTIRDRVCSCQHLSSEYIFVEQS